MMDVFPAPNSPITRILYKCSRFSPNPALGELFCDDCANKNKISFIIKKFFEKFKYDFLNIFFFSIFLYLNMIFFINIKNIKYIFGNINWKENLFINFLLIIDNMIFIKIYIHN